MEKRILRTVALFLAGLTLCASAFGCNPAPASPEETAATGEATVATQPPAGPTETDPNDPDAFENTVLLCADGKTDYTIVVPTYAASWEREAAARLAALLADHGATATVVNDTEAAATDKELVVGYTNRNGELPADFFAVGQGGYHLRALGNKLFLGANTAAGMEAALARLIPDLLTDGNRLAFTVDYVCHTVDESEVPTPPTLSGSYADTIQTASLLANGVQGYFTDGARSAFVMENQNMSINTGITAAGGKQVNALCNANGIPYVVDTMGAYLLMKNGNRLDSTASTANGRMNIYRYGYYYYEAHVLEQNFGGTHMADPNGESYELLPKVKNFHGNDCSAQKDKDGNLVITVENTNDPYAVFGGSFAIPTATYDSVQITLKSEYATDINFYFAAGPKSGIDGSQLVSTSISADGEFHTYIVPLDTVPDYTGNITAFRIDVGASQGEQIVVSEVNFIKAVQTDVPSILLDRTMHTYSDKLNHVLHFVATDKVDSVAAYGMETRVDASRVKSLLVVDKNGEHTDLEGVDWASVTAVAFDIDRAGVFGYILTTAEDVGAITVTEADGFYVIDQRQAAKDSYKEADEFFLGARVYTDMTHDFEGFRKAHREERNPITVKTTSVEFGAKTLGYDPLRGAYGVDMRGTDFSAAYYNAPDLHYRVDFEVKGDSADRTVYVYSHTLQGSLECAVLLDSNESLLPISLQVCKNFMGENEEPIFDKGDLSYGEAYFPVTVKAGETVQLTVLNLYQNWGIFPLKQISSIQFIAPYYHLSTGVTETNCIAPYYVYGKDRWTLPDFRAMSAPLWSSQPQHTSAGRLYFLEYTDAEGKSYASEDTVDTLLAYGPVYSDIWMNYISDDGRISVDYRHMEMPQTDENRTYYEIRMKVLEDIHIKDFAEDFNIFSMDGRSVHYGKASYLDENNEVVTTSSRGSSRGKFYVLGKESPFFTYHSGTNSNDYVNMGFVIKDWDIVIGGEAYEGNLQVYEAAYGSTNRARLTLDLEEVTLKAGDTISVNMILLPWGSQLTAAEDISSVLNVRRDTCLDPIKTEVKTGTLIEDVYMPAIRAEGGVAEFTLSGGANNMAVRVYGMADYGRPVIEEYVNGAWVAYDVASKNGYDGYMVHYDGDGSYSVSFIVPMEGKARTFRVS